MVVLHLIYYGVQFKCLLMKFLILKPDSFPPVALWNVFQYSTGFSNAENIWLPCFRSIMEKGGDLEDCISTPEADELSIKFADEQKARLPTPGEVDLIVGGPPCQVIIRILMYFPSIIISFWHHTWLFLNAYQFLWILFRVSPG